MTYLICLRDPRDLLVSLYFLAQDSTHIAMAEGTPIHEKMLIAAQKAAATPIDEYVLNSVASVRQLMEDLQHILAEIPSQKIWHLSYAALCQAFPQYLASLVDILGASPSRHTIVDILHTENIQRPKTLHRDSLAHFPKHLHRQVATNATWNPTASNASTRSSRQRWPGWRTTIYPNSANFTHENPHGRNRTNRYQPSRPFSGRATGCAQGYRPTIARQRDGNPGRP